MKVVTLMFDTLRRDVLPQYGGGMDLPNFKRLEENCITFDNFYAGSLPCMPARREMLTGHPNFLHRGWSPIEPFDTCFTEVLKESNVYSHLITDHQHYWEDGGATYHNRYSSYEFVRGQEGDLYKAHVKLDEDIERKLNDYQLFDPGRAKMFVQDQVNRKYMEKEEDYSQAKCVKLGLEFLEKNKNADNWYLQVECFDPHEPFFVPDRFKDMVDSELKNKDFDWPKYESTRSMDNPSDTKVGYQNYQALLYMIDEYLGKYLDFFDEHKLWEDTVLMLNTDHGFMFGEKEWSGKSCMPVYEEIAHTPFCIHIPNSKLNGNHVDVIAQTYDIADTIYELFDISDKPNTYGKSLLKLVENDDRVYGFTGYFAGHINIFDKQYTYMRGSSRIDNKPLEEYTLMPMRMRRIFNNDEFTNVKLADGLGYFKDWKVLCMDSNEIFYSPFASGNMLFNRIADPKQLNPIDNIEVEELYIDELKKFLKAVDAPKSQYTRLGLDYPTSVEEDRKRRKEILDRINEGIPRELIDRDMQATIINLHLHGKEESLKTAVAHGCKTTKEVRDFIKEKYPNEWQLPMLVQ